MPELGEAWDKANRAKYNAWQQLRDSEPERAAYIHAANVMEKADNGVATNIYINFDKVEPTELSSVLGLDLGVEYLANATVEQVEARIIVWVRDAMNHQEGKQ